MPLIPVEQDPFASNLTPVEYDPFKKSDVKLLPDFISLDTEESRKKRDQLIQEDPEKHVSLMQKANIEGINRGILDIGEGLKQLTLDAGEFIGLTDPEVSGDYTKKVQEEREKYEETYGLFPGAKVTRFIGSSAPYAYLPIKLPVGLTKRFFVGGAIGAGIGGSQFVKEGDSRALNMAAGAAATTVIPAIGKTLTGTLKWAKGLLIDPFTKKGAYKDIAIFLQKEIPENRDKIMSAMEASIARGENKSIAQIIADVTKGSKKDFGGMLVRLEKDLSRESDVLKSLYATQSQAKRGIIDNIAGTEESLSRAIIHRSNNASINYRKSYKMPITADTKLAKIGNNKFFKIAYGEAKDLAEVKGINTKENLTEFLHLVKEGLDKQLHSTDIKGKTTLGREELKAVRKIKDDLVEWMGKKNPLYNDARKQYITDSIPVNKMEVGNELKKAFIDALDNDKPLIFVKAIVNAHKTVKSATGMKGGLESILEPQQIKGLNAVKKGLILEAIQKKMAAASRPILKRLTGEIKLSLPHILSRPIVITNHLLKALGKDKTPEYKRLLVDIIRDPRKFLDAYRLPQKDPMAQMAMDIVDKLNAASLAQASQEVINE